MGSINFLLKWTKRETCTLNLYQNQGKVKKIVRHPTGMRYKGEGYDSDYYRFRI